MPDERGYLVIFEDDGWRKEMGRYSFVGQGVFQAWSDPQNDKLSSFRFKLPVGWGLRIYKHRDPKKESHLWVGTGKEESINKDGIPKFLHDEASGHGWVPV